MNTKNYIKPFILSGGSGKRLWPLSRSLYPKQFVNIKSKNSYYQDTLYRLNDPLYQKPNIICNIDHRFMVKDQANQIKIKISQMILVYFLRINFQLKLSKETLKIKKLLI